MEDEQREQAVPLVGSTAEERGSRGVAPIEGLRVRARLPTLLGTAGAAAPAGRQKLPTPPVEEIQGVPSGVDPEASPEDVPEVSKVYFEMEMVKGRDPVPSEVQTIPRSQTMDSLLALSEYLPPGTAGQQSCNLGDVVFDLPPPPATSTGPLWGESNEEAGTNVWDFVDEGDEDVASEENVIAGRYRIADDLGAGGMARIYKVAHLHLGKEFALKIIHPEMTHRPAMRRAFIREAQVASQLDHPNIVKVTDFGVDERRGAYIVMEYLRGDTLHARIVGEGRLRVAFALEVALQVAEALHYMHEQAIIHCDIKSENIFLCRLAGEARKRPTVKLIDFGLSRTEALGAKLAQSEVAGTPEYMAPEQISGLAPQPSIDIYALGVLLYQMIVGRLPFSGEITDVMRAQLEKEPPKPSEILEEELDERVEALILKALHKDPEERQRSMGQMIFEIRTLMDMLGVQHQRRRGAVVRRPVGLELEGPRLAFEHCPCPLFRLDRDAGLLAANAAFCDFVREPAERLVGKPLSATRLGPLYPDLRGDLSTCAEDGVQLQHLLSFKAKGDGRAAAALCWLVPEFDDQGECISFTGIIVPYQSAGGNGSPDPEPELGT